MKFQETQVRHLRAWRSVAIGFLCLIGLGSILRGEEPRLLVPAEIHSMSRDEAALGLPVKVRGVVTFAYPEQVGDFVIQDDSGGVYVSASDGVWNGKRPPVSSLVEVTGVTGPGGFAPVVRLRSFEILGPGEMAIARPATITQLLTGRFDSRRVEFRGVVRHATHLYHVDRFSMELVGEFGRVMVFALDTGGVKPEDLIDAEVTVRAVCFLYYNERAQVSGVHLKMMSAGEIEINRPPAAEPFLTPLVRLDRLQPFSPKGMDFHRQRIQGTVTLVSPEKYLYVQDGDHAIRVNLAERYPVKVGDRIEAVGFPGVRSRFVEWQEALIKKTGTAPVPAPVPIHAGLVLHATGRIQDRAHNDWDGRLVSLTGRLEKTEVLKNKGHKLYMDCDGHGITALLEWSEAGNSMEHLRAGSMIAVSGICVVDYSKTWPVLDYPEPSEMQLLVRGPGDIQTLQAASWWTPGHLRLALGTILLILLASLVWARSLRVQVIKRTVALDHETRARRDAEVEFDATLRERERMAVDLHDTVEQALTGVSYQLVVSEALYESEPKRSMQHLELAKQLLAQSREEVRRSVWNLRAQSLNGRNLAEVLRDVAAGLSTRNPVQTRVTVVGEERGFPDFIAGHLLLLAQESMTNAIKHAHPENIHIALEFGEKSVELRVHDDGVGFDPDHAPGLAEGHLGLQGMRERMKRLGGEVKVESSSGYGTTVRARVPLPD